ncbi:MAG TPA: RNA polymerase subunit sigma-24 [Candidatus Omnitrophica bacterium]|nr:RNA polymerase subunit sigma-24 [Candidatus Omnitrophota bacterium]
MDVPDEDIRLMLLFQGGEASCFEELVERHKNRVFNLAYRFLGNSHEAQDIAQEVFIKIYHAKDTYRPQAKFTTWLYIICKNTCLKALRKKKPAAISIDDTLELAEGSVAPQLADTSTPSPSASLLNSERASVIKEAVDSLPANQKMALVLCRYEQLSYEEAAEVIGCSVKAVKSLLHRAKINLKEGLAAYLEK